jgi:hypothetical protein
MASEKQALLGDDCVQQVLMRFHVVPACTAADVAHHDSYTPAAVGDGASAQVGSAWPCDRAPAIRLGDNTITAICNLYI